MQPGNTPHRIDDKRAKGWAVEGSSAYEQNPPHLINDDTISRLNEVQADLLGEGTS
jgi:hypothetical protein